MRVLDLRCTAGHAFEGWFASEEDYRSQHQSGLLECPVCGISDIVKMPSAPRLNLSGAQAPVAAATSLDETPPQALPATQGEAVSRFMEAATELLNNTEDVGNRFAEEARRIHYGETKVKAIRGQATAAEREALTEEGIEVFSLPFPISPKTSLQ